MRKKIIAYIFFLFVLTNVFAAPPAWITGNDKRWPADKYLTGIGAAESISVAQDKARAEIAKVFKVAIEQIAMEKSSETGGLTNDSSSFLVQKVEVEQKTTSLVTDKIEGIEIAQVWYDKKEKLYWALAVLNKQKYAALLSDRILELENKINSSIKSAEMISDGQIPSALERLKHLSVALDALEAKEDLLIRQRAIGVGSGGVSDMDSITTQEKIKSEIASIKSSTIFRIVHKDTDDSNDESVEKLKQVFYEKLSDLGFKVSGVDEKSEEVSYPLVEFRFSVTPFARQGTDNSKDYWKYARWEGYFEVKDFGKVIISAGASGSESNPDENVALKKAQLAGLKIIGDLFERKLKQEFGGAVQVN